MTPEGKDSLATWIAEQRARVQRTRELNAPGFEEQYKQGFERCLDELEEWQQNQAADAPGGGSG